MKGLVWWSDRLVGLRAFIAGPGGVGDARGMFGGYLKVCGQTTPSIPDRDTCVAMII